MKSFNEWLKENYDEDEDDDKSFFPPYTNPDPADWWKGKDPSLPNRLSVVQRRIQQYIKNGSIGDLDLSSKDAWGSTTNSFIDAMGGRPRSRDITSLPDNLTHVGGDFYISYTNITKLPDNLKVEGDLDLVDTPIVNLPVGLKVGGSLDLSGTKVVILPKDLIVGGNLFVMETPVNRKYSSEQLKTMLPGVKGNIYDDRSDAD